MATNTKLISNKDLATKLSPIQCICGEYLTKIDLSDFCNVHHIQGLLCDNCNSWGKENDIFWHCDDEYNIVHVDGYDICDKCVKNNQYKQQQSKPNDVEIDIDDHPKQYAHKCKANETCEILHRFLAVVKKYNAHNSETVHNMDNANALQTLDDFFHTMYEHTTDAQFESIVEGLGYCDMNSCDIFMRNNRNKSDDGTMLHYMHYVMDKIHCYFQHCYDIGNRLSVKEKMQLNTKYATDESDEKDVFKQVSLNKQITETNKMLHSKRKRYKKMCTKLDANANVMSKYNQLYAYDDNKQNEEDDIKKATYSFGYMFEYGFGGETVTNNSITIKAKYASLKQELTQNDIATVSVPQYNNEYNKAQLHFNSRYFKQNEEFASYKDDSDGLRIEWVLYLEYLLSIMIYCNYTTLQYEFSKTYRENNGFKHNNFYFLGKYLKISVHHFGTKINSEPEEINTFYHGIGEQLLFPQYIGYRGQVKISGPLSTSTSFEVASNFANMNTGLIIKFGEGIFREKYFSVSWLSDYANEKEYLFIQNKQGLIIEDIVDIHNGFEYALILNAVQLIENMTVEGSVKVDASLQALMKAIFSHRLANKFPGYTSFQSLTEFGANILDTFFRQKTDITVTYWKLRKRCSFLSDFFVYSDYEWINLKLLNVLFPNVATITVKEINLCSTIFDNILLHIQNNTESKLKQITISGCKLKNAVSIKDVMQKYCSIYRGINAFIYANLNNRQICIERCSKLEFVIKVIDYMNALYFVDKENEIETFIQRLTQTKLAQLPRSSQVNDADQQCFDQFCNEMECVQIFWDDFCLNKHSYLFSLICHSKYEWVNIATLNQLFVNMKKVKIANIDLHPFIFEDILDYLTTSTVKSKLQEIRILQPYEEGLKMDDAVVTYKKKFDSIDFTMSIEMDHTYDEEGEDYLLIVRKSKERKIMI